MPLSPTLADAPPRVPVLLGVPQLPAARARRLAELGLRSGARVTVLHRTAGGGRLVGVGQTRIALDRETAAALPVESVPVESLPVESLPTTPTPA